MQIHGASAARDPFKSCAVIHLIRNAYAAAMRRCRNGAARDLALTSVALIGGSAFAFMPLALLFWVMQPKVLANPSPHVPALAHGSYPEPPPGDEPPARLDAPPAHLDAQSPPVRQFAQSNAQLRPDSRRARQVRALAGKRK